MISLNNPTTTLSWGFSKQSLKLNRSWLVLGRNKGTVESELMWGDRGAREWAGPHFIKQESHQAALFENNCLRGAKAGQFTLGLYQQALIHIANRGKRGSRGLQQRTWERWQSGQLLWHSAKKLRKPQRVLPLNMRLVAEWHWFLAVTGERMYSVVCYGSVEQPVNQWSWLRTRLHKWQALERVFVCRLTWFIYCRSIIAHGMKHKWNVPPG